MKQSSQYYIVAFILFIISIVCTGVMIYLYLYKGMIILSIPFFMLGIIPVSVYSAAIYVFILAKHQAKLEFIAESFDRNYKRVYGE